MYDYARSDTHFLLYIFDNIRNELLAKSNAASSDGSLIDVVHDKSKGEALQRYERYFYDMNTGSGVWGWRNMLGRSADRLDAQQFAVLRAVHEWRDRIAREEDESLQQILTNRALMLISREMPTALPQLLSFCQPSHMATRKRAQELLELVKRAKAEGANGPEIQDFIIPRGHPNMDHINSIALAAATPRAKSTPVLAGQTLRPEPTSGIIPASLNVSQFWGTTIKGNAQSANGGGTSEPRLALPLPPLTAQVFETRNTDESLRPVKAPTDPGNRAEHQYTKKRKPQEEDVFVVKQGGSKKRRKTDTQDGPEPVQTDRKVADENGIADGDAGQGDTRLVEVEGEGVGLSKSQQRLWRKRKLQEARQDADGNGEAFDYENAPSALHGRRENAGGSGVTRRFDPYSKSLDAPKGMRKVQREGPGRSMTYKS